MGEINFLVNIRTNFSLVKTMKLSECVQSLCPPLGDVKLDGRKLKK